jgi:F-type H+-transporting ATPase subunit epsilon
LNFEPLNFEPTMADTFQLTIVTPEAVALEKTVLSAVLPAFDGEVGILPKHAPMVVRLGAGEVRIRDAAGTTSLFVDGGVAQVRDNVVTVLTNASSALEQLDVDKAKRELAEVLARKPATAVLSEQRAADADRARAKVRLAERVRRK